MLKRIWKLCSLLILAAVLFTGAATIKDYQNLTENVIRLHVVANSNSAEDQALKLQVKDTVVEKLEQIMQQMPSAADAKAYLQEKLVEIEELVNEILAQAGVDANAVVTLKQEAFGIREYDTFSLPSGVYESLRIQIGDGAGKNWWCVVFPTLCLSATSEGFADVAVGAGFSEDLALTINGEPKYEVRFFLLDCIGKLDSFLFDR